MRKLLLTLSVLLIFISAVALAQGQPAISTSVSTVDNNTVADNNTIGNVDSKHIEYSNDVYFVTLKGVITGTAYNYLKNGLDKAVQNNARAYVIRLDTPGGLLSSTRDIVQMLFESPIPVAVFVSPRGSEAGSAGAFITLAANYAVMTDGSSIGAAHPVSGTGEDIEGDMRSKVMNSTESFMRNIAEKRDRNMEESLLMVTESKSFTASEALKAGLIDSVVDSDEALLLMLETSLNTEKLSKVEITPSLLERLSLTLADPNILIILLLIGVGMIALEFKAPGTFVFATIGGAAILLFLFGANIIPINYLAFALLLVGIGLVVAEVFISAYGVIAIVGAIAIVFGMRLLFDTSGVQGVQISWSIIITSLLLTIATVLTVGRLIIKDHIRKPIGGFTGLMGIRAEVISWDINKKHGKAKLNGEIWNVFSDEELKVGDITEVVASGDGLELKLGKRKVKDEPKKQLES